MIIMSTLVSILCLPLPYMLFISMICFTAYDWWVHCIVKVCVLHMHKHSCLVTNSHWKLSEINMV